MAHKGCGRKSAHISYVRCPHGPVPLSHALSVAPELAASMRNNVLSRWLNGHTEKVPNQLLAVLYPSDSRGRMEVRTMAVAHRGERYR